MDKNSESKENQIKEIVKRAIDLHVHGPDVFPRRFNDLSLLKKEEGRLAGLVLKSHFKNMVVLVEKIKKNHPKLQLFGSFTFNNGFVPQAVEILVKKTPRRIIFFGPTLAAKNHLDRSDEFVIRPDWVKGTDFKPILKKDIKPVTIFNKQGKIANKVIKVLEAIKKTKNIFATGHLSAKEITAIAPFFRKIGLTVILTHPFGSEIGLTEMTLLKKIMAPNIYYEYCHVFKRDEDYPGKYDLRKIVKTLKMLSPNCVISSDCGQIHNPGPGDCLIEACQQLAMFGLTKKELQVFLIKNPRKILSI